MCIVGDQARAASGPRGPVRPTSMRHMNAREVFAQLRANSPCSRADLCRLTGLSAPTVSAVIDHLERRGLVSPVGVGASAGGRPPNLLTVKPSGAYVIGCELSANAIDLTVADLEGTRVGNLNEPLARGYTPKECISSLNNAVQKLLAQAHVAKGKLRAICVAAPGITLAESGILVSAPHLGWASEVALKPMIQENLKIHTCVENDVNLSALGEYTSGVARSYQDFVFLSVGDGVGAGIFVNGQLLRGRRGTAGEIGYMQVRGIEPGRANRSTTGSLEDAVGSRGVTHAWQELLRKKAGSQHELLHLFQSASLKDDVAAALIHRSAAILSDVIANIALLLDPSVIVLGGSFGTSPALLQALRARQEQSDVANPALLISALGRDATLTGSVQVALEQAEDSLLQMDC